MSCELNEDGSHRPTLFEKNQHKRMLDVKKRAINFISEYKMVDISLKDEAKWQVKLMVDEIYREYPYIFGGESSVIYVHVDLDSFFASVEMMEKPEYKNIPIGIGSDLMLSTCNYVAREFGVRAGMPGYMGRNLCPDLKILPGNMEKYKIFSKKVMDVLKKYDNELSILSIDEACLCFFREDFSAEEDNPWPKNIEELTEEIRKDVFLSTGLTISAGLSVTGPIAKLCSNIKKPNGQFSLFSGIQEFLSEIPVSKINGIGKVTSYFLKKSLDVETVQNLRENIHKLFFHYSKKSLKNLLFLSYGLPGVTARPDRQERSSISTEYTFRSGCKNDELYFIIWQLSKKLYLRILASGSETRTITLKVKNSGFQVKQKQISLKKCIKNEVEIYNIAIQCLMEVQKDDFFSIRLLGLKANLIETGNILELAKSGESLKSNDIYFRCEICQKDLIEIHEFSQINHIRKCKNIEKKKKQSILWYLE